MTSFNKPPAPTSFGRSLFGATFFSPFTAPDSSDFEKGVSNEIEQGSEVISVNRSSLRDVSAYLLVGIK
jgi:hypothetical protein